MITTLKNAGIGTTLAYEAKFINKKIMGITRNAEKVNSKSVLLGNSMKNSIRNIFKIVTMRSSSMAPLIDTGEDVYVRKLPQDTQYNIGDIIMFKRDGVSIIHEIVDFYVNKGIKYYVTGGINPETNLKVDSTTIAGEMIIGKVDLNIKTSAVIKKMIEQGKIHYAEAFGMPTDYQNRIQITKEIKTLVDDIAEIFKVNHRDLSSLLYSHKKILNDVFIRKADENRNYRNLPNFIAELMYNIYLMDIDINILSDYDYDLKSFHKIKVRAMLECRDFLRDMGFDPDIVGFELEDITNFKLYTRFKGILEDSLGGYQPRTLGPEIQRAWYDKYDKQIENIIDEEFYVDLLIENSFRRKALLCYHLRNIFRVTGRLLLSGSVTAEYWMNTRQVEIFGDLIDLQKSRGFYGEVIYLEMIKGSIRANEEITNKFLGVEN